MSKKFIADLLIRTVLLIIEPETSIFLVEQFFGSAQLDLLTDPVCCSSETG